MRKRSYPHPRRDAAGARHRVGAHFCDIRGMLLGLQGFYLDLTPAAATAGDHREQAARQLRAAAAVRDHTTEEQRQRIRAATRC
ncbi:hypothetical protein [Mycobacterium sp.]|uniref:hypothetical protein n=1 Tax=Mycobacterium sp. TaxID=1785 RepID=UPI00126FEF37|nr:hypothetical protein [Mycobacterium sp.]KAA8939229.1 MAG: hypothetical protein F6Q13_19215 [Mycobacterium sp.]